MFRTYSTISKRNFKEIRIPVKWGHIAGKWWEPYDIRPILTIPGWQETCDSFERLLPLLNKDVSFLTIDLPGHGYSSRLPPGMYYNNLNAPILIKHLQNYFKWDKVSLMGHSLGAIMCNFFNMFFPKEVDLLIALDGFKPLHKRNNAIRMSEGIDELLKYDELARSDKEPPSYTLENIKKAIVVQSEGSINFEFADIPFRRSLAPSKHDPNKFYFTRDPRIKCRLIFNWPQEDMEFYMKFIKSPMLLLKATKSGYFESKENFYQLWDVLKKENHNASLHYIEGTHHVHLNEPEKVEGLVNEFLLNYWKKPPDRKSVV